MKCGHAANSLGKLTYHTGSPIPAGAICDCFEIAAEQPKLEERKARCTYYGQKRGRRGRCDYPKEVRTEDDICRCETNSDSEKLPFFEYKPNEEFDLYYCGCAFGWD
jgi:hypothetical protein